MAGEWLKFDSTLPEKQETLAITAAMGWDDPDLTVGKLMRLFRWFDQHTIDGNAASVTPALLDRIVGVAGFVTAVADQGWIVASAGGIALRNFDRHNGKTAKDRALTAKRVANHRGNANSNDGGNAAGVTDALAREEKRRIEEEKRGEAPPSRRATKKCPADFEPSEPLVAWACDDLGLSAAVVRTETDKLRDHTFARAISDWPGAWRNWMRRAGEEGAKSGRFARPATTSDRRAATIAGLTNPGNSKNGRDDRPIDVTATVVSG